MLKKITRGRLIESWFAVVAVTTAVSAVLGAIPTVGTTALIAALSIAAAAMMLLLWPGVQKPTMAGSLLRD